MIGQRAAIVREAVLQIPQGVDHGQAGFTPVGKDQPADRPVAEDVVPGLRAGRPPGEVFPRAGKNLMKSLFASRRGRADSVATHDAQGRPPPGSRAARGRRR